MMTKGTAIALLTLVAAALAASANATTVVDSIEYARDQDGKMQSKFNRLYIEKGLFRSTSSGGNGVSIFREKKLYLLNPDDDSYFLMSKDTLSKSNGAYEQSMRDNSVKPPEVKREIRPTGVATLCGDKQWPCWVWHVFENDKLVQEICTVPFELLSSREALLETMIQYNDMMSGFESSTSDLPWRDVITTKGFPMQVINFVDGEVHSATKVFWFKMKEPYVPLLFLLPPGMHEGSKL